MAVNMRNWSPWSPASAGTRKFQVAAKPMRLDGFPGNGGDDGSAQKFVAIKIKWKGEPKLFPFQSRPKKELSSQKIVPKGLGIIQWDEDKWFDNTCCFSVASNHNNYPKFGAWEIAFNVLYWDKMDSKAKKAVIGRVSINLSEIALKTDNSSVEQKLPLSLQIDGITRHAFLTVLFNFAEIRDSQDSAAITRGGSVKSVEAKYKENVKARRRSLSQEEVSPDESDESKDAEQTRKNDASGNVLVSDKKEGWFSWKSRRFSFKRAKTKEDKGDEKAEGGCVVNVDPLVSASQEGCHDNNPEGAWEEKEIISRDGQVKLRAPVFLASFDQRSDKAAGESACTALVAVISHWLHLNSQSTPDRSQFDNLITEGSSEWRKLCEDATYCNDFPDKHFDLETILRADLRPISISHNNSFVGFFGADKFEALKGVMSFDDIWDEISRCNTPRIYIVSWNDHFFVLKVDSDAYYIIDTLGERLYEGCNQAYILRFDENALMQKQTDKSENEEVGIICGGKECCREFMKRFLAAIPLKELEEKEKKNAVSYFSLHQRLQIEFNYTCLFSPSPSLTSSPFSSQTTSSPLSE
ncbi:hypothetical protein CASFOL_000223 [Castilleja foliolosa]|uniref:C2 NT-type domain-containing protein n=1 Tax=Castilleja foliolosa TaxID=1961234 RepID=A0ABD3ENM2_9LAMI